MLSDNRISRLWSVKLEPPKLVNAENFFGAHNRPNCRQIICRVIWPLISLRNRRDGGFSRCLYGNMLRRDPASPASFPSVKKGHLKVRDKFGWFRNYVLVQALQAEYGPLGPVVLVCKNHCWEKTQTAIAISATSRMPWTNNCFTWIDISSDCVVLSRCIGRTDGWISRGLEVHGRRIPVIIPKRTFASQLSYFFLLDWGSLFWKFLFLLFCLAGFLPFLEFQSFWRKSTLLCGN